MHTVAKYNFLFKNHVLSMISILARKIQIQCWRLGVDFIKIDFFWTKIGILPQCVMANCSTRAFLRPLKICIHFLHCCGIQSYESRVARG